MANGNEPATKADVNELGEQLRSEVRHGFDRVAEAIRHRETQLLKAFYAFAEMNQQRLSQS